MQHPDSKLTRQSRSDQDPEISNQESRVGRVLAKRTVHLSLVFAGMAILLTTIVLLTQPIARQVSSQVSNETSPEIERPVLSSIEAGDPYTLTALDIHPDYLFTEYFGGVFSENGTGDEAYADFRWRLEMFERTYGDDDNFTIRVYDDRSGEILEGYTLRHLKEQYERTGYMDWEEVDFPTRRTHSERLRDKWEALGIPREDITLRWGRANQSLKARERDEPYIQYEINLARRLGLSVLATEIGTVETFNQDHLVSSAGARSRYQLMPDNLRLFDVERYTINTVSGPSVYVREEEHPLLAMEPSMMIVKAYSNAVGHELPGVSAYHTGPGNIFRLYQAYLRANASTPPLDGHVSDAYMWGVTDGFERVRSQSSFGPHSRAYVMKAYGALRATEDKLIDPAQMLRVDRVEVREGEMITLERILTTIGSNDRLNWGADTEALTAYQRFQKINPHIRLPDQVGDEFPEDGNLRLTSTADGHPVRFFLPHGAIQIMERVGLNVFTNVFEFNENTYLVENSEITQVDRQYNELVENIGQFGFNDENKRELNSIYYRLSSMAQRNPTRYRQTQARIAQLHRSIWNTRAYRDLEATAETFLSIIPNRRAIQAELAIVDSLESATRSAQQEDS